MSQAPTMPMYWDAYLADTTHLTTEEHGAYLLLLGAMWRRNGWVPDNDPDLARMLRLSTPKWRKIKERLRNFLIFKDGEISQKKLLGTWNSTLEKIEKNRKNGERGGRPKVIENSMLGKPNGFPSDIPNESIPEPEPEEVAAATSSEQELEDLRWSRFLQELTSSLGIPPGAFPRYWRPPASIIHVKRWVTDLGLSQSEIITAARSSRQQHSAPPDGPKALDRVMQTLAKAKASSRMPTSIGLCFPTENPTEARPPRTGADIPSENFPGTLPPADPAFAIR